jgi:single-strand DNA-binding protein
MVNKIILIGRVGNDPDIKTTQDGREIANFSLATSESWKDKSSGERKSITDWHKIVVFNEGLVKVIKQYIKKGSHLYIEGASKTRKWTDKDGGEKYITEVVLQSFGGNITMLDGKGDDGNKTNTQEKASGYANKKADPAYQSPELDDDIPF